MILVTRATAIVPSSSAAPDTADRPPNRSTPQTLRRSLRAVAKASNHHLGLRGHDRRQDSTPVE